MGDTGAMIHIQSLIDDAKCFETVRSLRWPDGVQCPNCESPESTKPGSVTQVMLATRCHDTVGQKHHPDEGGQQQP